jgi:rhodanese-related sulfurtransferase
MDWTTSLILAAVLAVYFLLKYAGQISPKQAAILLKNGALLIDVRSRSEFASGHLKNAINLPLGEIESALPHRVKDKRQALLLHCQSGMRSGVARRKLKALGYANTFNLGSYGRAERIVSGK